MMEGGGSDDDDDDAGCGRFMEKQTVHVVVVYKSKKFFHDVIRRLRPQCR